MVSHPSHSAHTQNYPDRDARVSRETNGTLYVDDNGYNTVNAENVGWTSFATDPYPVVLSTTLSAPYSPPHELDCASNGHIDYASSNPELPTPSPSDTISHTSCSPSSSLSLAHTYDEGTRCWPTRSDGATSLRGPTSLCGDGSFDPHTYPGLWTYTSPSQKNHDAEYVQPYNPMWSPLPAQSLVLRYTPECSCDMMCPVHPLVCDVHGSRRARSEARCTCKCDST